MSWWGKVIGGAFGFMLGGPLGAVLGAAAGHQFDQGLNVSGQAGFAPGNRERVQTAFFTATFSIMGYIAKADGHVSRDEIRLAESVMAQMQLDAEQKRAARELFNQGKRSDFPFNDIIDQFRRECRRRHTLLQMFLEMQIHAALADGILHTTERSVLETLCVRLGFSAHELEHLIALVQAQHGPHAGIGDKPGLDPLKEAYKVLDLDEGASHADIKKAYRRLTNQHHPDKLVAKGLPEEMMKIAAEKTHEIRQAYETLRKARGF